MRNLDLDGRLRVNTEPGREYKWLVFETACVAFLGSWTTYLFLMIR